MKVLSFNLRCADDKNGHSVTERAPRVQKVLEGCDADLMGFQEVTEKWYGILTDICSDKYEIYNVFRSNDPGMEASTVMWRKGSFELIDKGTFWFSDTPDILSQGWDEMGCKRVCSWVKLVQKSSGVEFYYFNTHYGFGDQCQLKSTGLILDHLEAMKAEAAIITGDFNMKRDSASYRMMTRILDDVNQKTQNDTGNTFHGYSLNESPNLIDFCFVTRETVKPVSSRRVLDTFEGKFPSDHYPVLSEIELVGQRFKIVSQWAAPEGVENMDELTRVRRFRAVALKREADLVLLQHADPVWAQKLESIPDMKGTSTEEFSVACKCFEPAPGPSELIELLEGARCVRTALTAGGKKRALVFNVDFSNAGDKARAVSLLKAEAAKADVPVIMAGNFGFDPASSEYALMCEEFIDSADASFVDSMLPTEHNFGKKSPLPRRLDYIFLSKDIELKAYSLWTDRYKGEFFNSRFGVCCEVVL